ncbi:HTH_Tnp_Tc3_2 domain-containing protein [Trichonephila clavipes]|nr:HTH_Tnp_Tc3_2 domain-containing protein [Trichonephila clavipes]
MIARATQIAKHCASLMRKRGRCGNCIYSTYCDSTELVVRIANIMGKLPDLDALDRGQIVGEQRMRIVRSQRSQTLTQLNGGASRTVSTRNVQHSLHHMSFESHRPAKVPLFHVRNRAASLVWEREHINQIAENWKRISWSNESSLRLFNAEDRLRIWRQAHEARDHAFQI